MSDFQAGKALVRRYNKAIDAAQGDDIARVLEDYTACGYVWHGMHPFNELTSVEDVVEIFWKPFRQAIRPIQRRPDMFLAGMNYIDGFASEWVVSMGHLMGLFEEDWLGIPASGKMVFLRFAEFHRIQDGTIAETALFCDIPGVMRQVGLDPFPPQTGAYILSPGPATHDGLLYEPQDPAEGRATLDLINRMLDDLIGAGVESPIDDLKKTWHPDMIWFGPTGIGASYTFERYRAQHCAPFEQGLAFLRHNGHVCRIGEGRFGGFFGYPSITVKCRGGFMGLTAHEKEVDMRIVDMYRRDGDRLAENWIFIDMLHFLSQQGVDLLARMKGFPRT